MGWESEGRDANGRWIGNGNPVVGLQSALDDAHKQHLKGMLGQIRAEHTSLANKLDAGSISDQELNRLDDINKFVQRNEVALLKLK